MKGKVTLEGWRYSAAGKFTSKRPLLTRRLTSLNGRKITHLVFDAAYHQLVASTAIFGRDRIDAISLRTFNVTPCFASACDMWIPPALAVQATRGRLCMIVKDRICQLSPCDCEGTSLKAHVRASTLALQEMTNCFAFTDTGTLMVPAFRPPCLECTGALRSLGPPAQHREAKAPRLALNRRRVARKVMRHTNLPRELACLVASYFAWFSEKPLVFSTCDRDHCATRPNYVHWDDANGMLCFGTATSLWHTSIFALQRYEIFAVRVATKEPKIAMLPSGLWAGAEDHIARFDAFSGECLMRCRAGNVRGYKFGAVDAPAKRIVVFFDGQTLHEVSYEGEHNTRNLKPNRSAIGAGCLAYAAQAGVLVWVPDAQVNVLWLGPGDDAVRFLLRFWWSQSAGLSVTCGDESAPSILWWTEVSFEKLTGTSVRGLALSTDAKWLWALVGPLIVRTNLNASCGRFVTYFITEDDLAAACGAPTPWMATHITVDADSGQVFVTGDYETLSFASRWFSRKATLL